MSLDSIPKSSIETPIIKPPVEKHSQPVGPIVGIVVIVLLLIVGALYFWGEQLNKQATVPSYIPGDQIETQ